VEAADEAREDEEGGEWVKRHGGGHRDISALTCAACAGNLGPLLLQQLTSGTCMQPGARAHLSVR
jgi:hypothetical protein